MVGEWYAGFYIQDRDVQTLTEQQIEQYMQLAMERDNRWTHSS